MTAPLTMFRPGDLVRVRHRGQVLRHLYVFEGLDHDTTGEELVSLRRQGWASPRLWRACDVELIDHDDRKGF